MDTHRFVIESSEVPWKALALDRGGEAQLQMYLRGADGGPEAVRARISEGYEVEPHFHLAAQFQLLLAGAMQFPTFRLEAPAVHYTEHNVPYGPFTVSAGHDMLVLHTKPGGVVLMRDRERRYQANTRGRELTRCAQEVAWEPLPGYEGARRKVLIPASAGPAAEIIECPPHLALTAPAPSYGRYEVVYKGSAFVNGKELGPLGLRFIEAGEEAVPLRCGPEGATLIILTYDEDAAQSYGGSTEEVIARMEK
jgi:hypothetical protein